LSYKKAEKNNKKKNFTKLIEHVNTKKLFFIWIIHIFIVFKIHQNIKNKLKYEFVFVFLLLFFVCLFKNVFLYIVARQSLREIAQFVDPGLTIENLKKSAANLVCYMYLFSSSNFSSVCSGMFFVVQSHIFKQSLCTVFINSFKTIYYRRVE
jgi:hypothetical protein